MATATTLISIDEYLRTSYHPDADFVDGRVEERHGGEFDHSHLQAATATFFYNNEKAWNILTVIAQRIRVAKNRVRICDVCLISRDAPREQVTQTPPLACIEILSPVIPANARLPRAAQLMQDYARMGVQNLWLLDPIDRVAYVYTAESQFKIVEGRLTIPNTQVHLDLPTLFEAIT